MSVWSPSQYLKFADERSRPARDLLSAVPLSEVRRAVDIGCGPGNSTELLVERFPGAEIVGLANATFQWVPDHQAVLKRLFATLPADGVLAVQMPDNVATEPSHTLMREVAEEGPWASRFVEPIAREAIGTPADYYNLLQEDAARIDVWHTLYNHPLANAAAIIEMVRSTGLRPYLARLSAEEQGAFLEQYQARLTQAYPPLADGKVLFRFPRLFIVAVRA